MVSAFSIFSPTQLRNWESTWKRSEDALSRGVMMMLCESVQVQH